MSSTTKPSLKGPYTPTLIIHGGAGSITRPNLPPDLYHKYETALLSILLSTHRLLTGSTTYTDGSSITLPNGASPSALDPSVSPPTTNSPSSALDAAVYAVSCLEDHPLFNCGRGSVFTSAGEIEMEASLMVASVDPSGQEEGRIKRTAAVSMIRNTRQPIQLAKEVLLQAEADEGTGGVGSMHCHRNGRNVEEWGWKEKGVEYKEDEWFWTKKRWDEHRRGLGKQDSVADEKEKVRGDDTEGLEIMGLSTNDDGGADGDLPSQGTVGCVCMDSWGNLAVATSTGGLTNKMPGRIGDTPTVGAGFWAGNWDEENSQSNDGAVRGDTPTLASLLDDTKKLVAKKVADSGMLESLTSCLPHFGTRTYTQLPQRPEKEGWYRCSLNLEEAGSQRLQDISDKSQQKALSSRDNFRDSAIPSSRTRRRAIALAGTGNGDSFLRTAAAHTTAALCQYSQASLGSAVTSVAGPNGVLQRSAGARFGKTGEGEGGIIGIEVISNGKQYDSNLVMDFNCGGMWRAWFEKRDNGVDWPMVRVFREDYALVDYQHQLAEAHDRAQQYLAKARKRLAEDQGRQDEEE